MADEEQTTNTDSFATLSEASFAEDWDSKEDRVYDEPEARLAALLAANGPLPNEHYHPLAAAALRLARALRAAWNEKPTMSPEEMYRLSQEAFADWDRWLKRLGDG